jgi:iron complex outermembrane recepter protein
MGNRYMSRQSTVAMAVMAALGVSPVMAAESNGELEEVVVTAQFRAQNLQDTPIAITAVTGDMLEQRSQNSIFQVAAQAPNVSLSPQGQGNGSGMIAFIRGVGQTDFNFALEPGVGLYIDDVYYSTLTGSLVDLTDLERVEISRGPQGTLAGRNSIGGAVKMYSRKPTGNGGSVSLTYGEFNRVDVRATADFALQEDKVFMRLAGVSKNRDGFVDRLDYACSHPGSGLPATRLSDGCKLGTLGGISYNAGRASLRWVASDNVEVNLIGDITNDNSESGAEVLLRAVQTIPATDARFIRVNGVPLDCRFVPNGPNSCDPNGRNQKYISYASFADNLAPTTQRPAKPVIVPPIQQLDQHGLSAAIDWKLGENYSLKSVTAWREYDSSWGSDADNSPLPSQQLLQTLKHWQKSQELRLNGQALNDKLDFTLGAFYFKQGGTLEARVDLNYSGIDFIHGPDPTPSRSAAVFAHSEWHLTDSTDFTAGLRYTDDHKSYTFFRRNPDGSIPTTCSGPPNLPTTNPNCVLTNLYDRSASFDSTQLDWRAVLSHRWSDAISTYVSASTGYKGGGINPRPFFPQQILGFKPEELTTYEVGAKTDLFDRRLRVNGAVFFNKYKDIILTLSNCPGLGSPAAPCALPANIGKADVKGVELEVNLRVGGGFSIDAAFSKLDFQYKDTGGTAVTTAMITPYTPELKGSLGLQFEHSMPSGAALILRGDWQAQSEIFAAAVNNQFNRIPGYGLGTFRATWRSAQEDWETSFEMANVNDKLYYFSKNDFSALNSAGTTAGQPGLPRTWALSVKRKF